MSWWKHAFAVEPEGPTVPTPQEQAVIDALCRRIVDRGLALPAILFLESSQPLGPMAAQSLLMLQPWFEFAVDRHQLEVLTKFLDHRGSFETLCRRIEELSGGATGVAGAGAALGEAPEHASTGASFAKPQSSPGHPNADPPPDSQKAD